MHVSLTRILLALSILISTQAGAKEPLKVWKGEANRQVANEHMVMAMSDEAFYTDRYTAEAWFEDGTRVWVSVLANNLGPIRGKMTVKSRWYESGGKEHYFKKELRRGNYDVKRAPFSVDAAGHKIWGSPRAVKVNGQSGAFSYSLTFSSGLRPWRPGTGRTEFGDAGSYFDTTLMQPKAKVTGWVKRGGSKTKLAGYGYVTHTHTNMAPHNMFKRFIEIRSIDGDTVLYLKRFKTPRKYGGKAIGYLYLARGGKVIARSTGFRLKADKFHTDSKHRNRYKVPMELSLSLKRKGKTIDIKVVASEIRGRDDVLASMGMLKRALVRQFAQPVNYTMTARVKVSIKEGDAEPVVSDEKAVYELSYMNK
jgi:hypothetical protein